MPRAESEFSVRIQPELRGLRRRVECHPDCASATSFRPRHAFIRLRCDGARPLCFEGLALLHLDLLHKNAMSTCGKLALYVASDGRIAAHLAFEKPEDRRPAFRAAWISDVSDLHALIGRTGLVIPKPFRTINCNNSHVVPVTVN